MIDVICAVVAAAATVICAIIARNGKKQSDKADARAELRRRESMLSLKLAYATCSLSLVEAEALTHGHLNGNVEAAKEAAQKASDEYTAFMQEVTARQVTK